MLVQAVFRRSLHHHTIHFTELVIVRYVRTTAIAAQCIEHCSRRNTGTLTFSRIYFYRYLRKIDGICRVSHSYFRTLIQCAEELHYRLVECFHIATRLVLKVQFEGVTHTIPRNHSRLETEYLRFLNTIKLSIEAGNHSIRTMILSFSFAPVLQAHNDCTVRSSLTGYKSIACYAGIMFYFRRIPEDIFQFIHYLRCFIKRASR